MALLGPGQVHCGSAGACATATHVCCQQADAPGTGTFRCVARSTCPGKYDAEVRCEKKNDCPDAEVCCAGIGLNGNLRAACATSCDTMFQRCASAAECADCAPRDCHGYPIRTCLTTKTWCE